MEASLWTAESFCCSLELSQHCLLVGYTSIQNKSVFFFFLNVFIKKKTKNKDLLLCLDSPYCPPTL